VQGASQQLGEGEESTTMVPHNKLMTTMDNSEESKIVTLMWVIYNIPFNKSAEHSRSGLSTPVDWV
jgi:hypothetical protein